MKATIYQTKADYLFFDFDFAKEHGFNFYMDYDEVYSIRYPQDCFFSDEDLLEIIYKDFNINRPEDFKGHSLSVGDIVRLDNRCYYCENLGWKKLSKSDLG